ncbi:MAG: 1-deoxy-D-xylulose-5-phosphate reductoisomerase [Candidatus Dasytiphilus stammeri]
MKRLTILGSTGSVGTTTLKIVEDNPHLFTIKALVAGKNIQLMTEQCKQFNPLWAAMEDERSAKELQRRLQYLNLQTKVLVGEKAACELSSLEDIDQVMAAMVGSIGLLPIMSAILAGKQVLLANKEALVMSGHFFMEAISSSEKAQLLPVDSEHSAIFQILPQKIQNKLGVEDLFNHGIKDIILTGSGGPFRTLPLEHWSHITPEQACNHPTWKMGPKISVDSATMMNKGFEYIEASWLFNATPRQIEIVIHPQSVIHSMVRYIDGSIMAQLASPDMKLPIAYAMAWPKRINTRVIPLDFLSINQLNFMPPDFNRYPCLKLAMEAYNQGLVATIILNAANEMAVGEFLKQKVPFISIPAINQYALESFSCQDPKNVEEVIAIDHLVRKHIKNFLPRFTVL